ncbi:MAG: hypothetical protein KDK99_01620 [Verrucomicrobiales bacterium]|nr:hypothetical protein [Verrucomicrobiales bacterium]
MKSETRATILHLLGRLAILAGLILAVVCALLGLMVWSETAREVLSTAFWHAAKVVTTPFILEATLAAFGLLVVMAFNRWRIGREGDGWVHLEVPDQKETATDPPHRLQGVVVDEPLDPATAIRAGQEVVDGFLELDLAQEALEALPDSDSTNPLSDCQRLRALLMLGREDAAESIWQELRQHLSDPSEPEVIRQRQQLATWLQRHPKAAPTWRDQVG